MTKPMELGDIKEGSYIMIDNSPCKVVEVEKANLENMEALKSGW
jgi:Elongation factor P (EF-P) KOW-like domain.